MAVHGLPRRGGDLETLAALTSRFPHHGRVEWIGARPARDAALLRPERAEVKLTGLVGDRYAGRSGKRAVTLVQAEHLPVIARFCGLDTLDPAILRRNIVVSGLNLLALRGVRFRLGTALLEGTGPCAPCSKMERALGPGAYNALRGHGGLTARVLDIGYVTVGDAVEALPEASR